jgi:hypothetical protein
MADALKDAVVKKDVYEQARRMAMEQTEFMAKQARVGGAGAGPSSSAPAMAYQPQVHPPLSPTETRFAKLDQNVTRVSKRSESADKTVKSREEGKKKSVDARGADRRLVRTV